MKARSELWMCVIDCGAKLGNFTCSIGVRYFGQFNLPICGAVVACFRQLYLRTVANYPRPVGRCDLSTLESQIPMGWTVGRWRRRWSGSLTESDLATTIGS